MTAPLTEELLSVADAAALLRVNRSTILRWIAEGKLPAARIGARRLALRRADLATLVTPVGLRQDLPGMVIHESLDRSPLTLEERRWALAAMDAAERLAKQILAGRGGQPFTPE